MEKAMIIVGEGGAAVETKGPGRRTRANKKKKVSKYKNELTNIKEATRKMTTLEKGAVNLLMNMD